MSKKNSKNKKTKKDLVDIFKTSIDNFFTLNDKDLIAVIEERIHFKYSDESIFCVSNDGTYLNLIRVKNKYVIQQIYLDTEKYVELHKNFKLLEESNLITKGYPQTPIINFYRNKGDVIETVFTSMCKTILCSFELSKEEYEELKDIYYFKDKYKISIIKN